MPLKDTQADHQVATGERGDERPRHDAHPGPGGPTRAHEAHTESHGGHGGHAGGHGDHAAQFRDRFWLSVALSVPVVLYSDMVQTWLGFTAPRFPGSEWVAPA